MLTHGAPLSEPAAVPVRGQDGAPFGFFCGSVFDCAPDIDQDVSACGQALAPDGKR